MPLFKLPVGLAMAATLTNVSGLAFFAGFWPAHAEPPTVASGVNPMGSVETLEAPDVQTPALQSQVLSTCAVGDAGYDNMVCTLIQYQKTTAREAREDAKTRTVEKQQGEIASQQAFESDTSSGELGVQDADNQERAIQNNWRDLPRAKSPNLDGHRQLPVNAPDRDDSSTLSTAHEATITGACRQAQDNCPEPCNLPPCN